MKIVRRTAKVVLSLFVVLNIMLAFQAYRFTYFYDNPQKLPVKKAEDYSTLERAEMALLGGKFLKKPLLELPQLPYQTVRLINEAGQQLEAWYVPVDSARGTVILCHGHGSNKAALLCQSDYFHELGYNTLTFDFRAHGNSEGNVCTIGYEEVGDVKAAYDFVRQKGEQTIILWGASMGAATLLKAIPEYGLTPSRVILECPFASLYDAVKGRLRTMHVPVSPFSELLMLWGGSERGFWGFDHNPVDYAATLTMPVLLNWGARDGRVQRYETDAIFAKLSSPEKQLVIFNESGHESYCLKEPMKWKATIAQFLESSKPVTSPSPVSLN